MGAGVPLRNAGRKECGGEEWDNKGITRQNKPEIKKRGALIKLYHKKASSVSITKPN